MCALEAMSSGEIEHWDTLHVDMGFGCASPGRSVHVVKLSLKFSMTHVFACCGLFDVDFLMWYV